MDTRKRISAEDALQAVWPDMAGRVLKAEPGGEIVVRYPGMHRGAAGPDFKDAVLETGCRGVLCGDVEVHVCASDWRRHGHGADPAYENVVLHVVGAARGSSEALTASGRRVPATVLGAGPASGVGLPCAGAAALSAEHVAAVVRSAGYERLRWRALPVAERIRVDGSVAALGVLVARVLGYSANAAALQELGERVTAQEERATLCSMPVEQRRTAVL
jgi:hypothetical protein